MSIRVIRAIRGSSLRAHIAPGFPQWNRVRVGSYTRRVRIVACIALAALVWSAPHRVVALPPCEGDCNEDGAVGIDELVRAVNVALDVQPLTVCAAADTDGDGVVRINDLVAAVVRALLGCQLSPDDAAQAAALYAPDIVDSVTVLDFGVVGAQGGSGAAVQSGLVSLPCPGGGSSVQRCVVEHGISQLTVENTECRTAFADALVLITDGTTETTVDDAKFCDTRTVPAGVMVTEHSIEVRRRVVDRDGNNLAVLLETLKRSFVPSGIGCDGQDGTITVDGAKRFRCTASPLLPKGFPCPPEGRALTVEPSNLTIVRATQATTQGCMVGRTLVGEMTTIDAVSGERFDATYRQFFIRESVSDGNVSAVLLNGLVSMPCLGDLQYTTEKPLLISADVRCPSSGVLDVGTDDRQSRVRYGPGSALAIDYDGDGQADLQVDSCEDPTLARCE